MNLAIVKKNCLLLFILSACILTACTKITTTDIGGGLLPGVDNIDAKELYMDIATKNAGDSLNHVAVSQDFSLGYISNDPMFGKVAASVNVQLQPSTFPFSFGNYNKDSVWFDSAVLVMSYKGVWGDSFQNLAFRVYQISNDEPFSPDSVYSSAHLFDRNLVELTNGFSPAVINPRRLADSVYPYNEAATHQIRIKLDSATIGRKLVYAFDSSNAYKSATAFNQYFRGIQVKPEQTGNSLLRINVLDSNTKLAIYYRYADPSNAGKRDTAVNYWKATSGSTAASNYIKRDHSGALVQQYYPSSNIQDSLIFLEAGPGIFSTVTMPNLSSLKNIIIQRAEIVMDQVPDNSDLFLTPPQIFLTTYSTKYNKRFLTPGSQVLGSDSTSVSNLSSLGVFPLGTVDPLTGRTHYSYKFDLTQYVQNVVTHGAQQYNFVLYAPGNDVIYAGEESDVRVRISATPLNNPAVGRVVLGGGNSVNHKMRLHIVYSTVAP